MRGYKKEAKPGKGKEMDREGNSWIGETKLKTYGCIEGRLLKLKKKVQSTVNDK